MASVPLPGQSASPPPTLTPRLGAVPLSTPLSALALAPASSSGVPPSAPHAGLSRNGDGGNGDDYDDQDDEYDSRSPSPALTVSNGPTSPPSVADSLAPSPSAMTSPNPTTISTSSLPGTTGGGPGSAGSSAAGATTTSTSAAYAPKAEIGFGSLHAEDEIKKALSSKDRMWVLMLGKEYEAFIGRVARREYSARVPSSQASASTSIMEQLGPSKKIDVVAASKYHRMLTYKLAEWYGVRAVAGVDGSMVVGVLGTLDERCPSLKVSALVPETAAPQAQQFKIMRRELPDDDAISRATSVSGEDDGSGTRGRTLEERTAAYALARKRIIGDQEQLSVGTGAGGGTEEDTLSTAASSRQLSRSRRPSRFSDDGDDGMDTVPRRAYPGDYEFVYPSLYHTNEAQAVPQQQTQQQALVGGPNTTPQQGNTQQYGGYAPPYQCYMALQGMGYPNQQQQQYGMPQYQNAVNPGVNMYGQWQQPAMGPVPGMMGNQMPGGGVMIPMVVGGQGGWYPPDMSGMAAPMPNMMPMIPQGMPYPPSFGYQQQQQQLQQQQVQQLQQQQQPQPIPTLAQPMPMRAGVDPLSSTASSISSRSYQDVHSRPHSRGSTTSTRSAASSVRLGAMYATSQQPGYGFRQKAVKSSAQSSFTGMKPTMGGLGEPRRSGRQSPASTTSSRSSKRTSSIHITQPQPGQHPLPQRPDWAANNVPYHPSPMLPPGAAEASTSDFPPLGLGHRGGPAATNAEPMQIEKVKMRPPSNVTVWNGAAARNIQPGQGQQGGLQRANSGRQQQHQQHQQHQMHPPPPPPMVAPVTPVVSILPSPNKPPTTVGLQPPTSPPRTDMDPDFPRRMPSRTPSLYDPSAPRTQQTRQQSPTTSSVAQPPPAVAAPVPVPAIVTAIPVPASSVPVSPARPISAPVSAAVSVASVSVAGASSGGVSPVVAPDVTVGDEAGAIEARLAALSVKGVTGGGVARQVPSYAKIVQRD